MQTIRKYEHKLSKVVAKLDGKFDLLEFLDLSKLRILCKSHGEFTISYFNLMQNRNCCRVCGKVKKSENRKLASSDIITQFTKVHGNTYDYSNMIYEKSSIPITIICKTHGEFKQTPKNHKKGSGCHLCYLENINGKFMQKPKWRDWASNNFKEFRKSGRYDEIMMARYGTVFARNLPGVQEKVLNTLQTKYQVTNPWQINIDERIKKSKQTKIEKGLQLADEDRLPFEQYTLNVWRETRKSLKANLDIANQLLENNGRSNYHIDHIYSIKDGFVNGINPKIVGHITNLQRLLGKENQAKGAKSWITLADLLLKIKLSI